MKIAQPARLAPASEWAVYADALQEIGDPRGTLIVLNEAVASGTATAAERDAYVDENKQALFGPAAQHSRALRVTWHHCLAETVTIHVRPGASGEGMVKNVAKSPLGEHVRSIELVGLPIDGRGVDLARPLATLVANWPAGCRALAIVDGKARVSTMLSSRELAPSPNLVQFGSLAVVWSIPGLEELVIEVADAHPLALGRITAPALQRFALRDLRFVPGARDEPACLDQLAEADWPELRSFELRLVEQYMANIVDDRDAYMPEYFGNEAFEYTMNEAYRGTAYGRPNWDALRPLIASLAKTQLERLALCSFNRTDSLLAVLAAAGLPATLRELDLSDSTVSSAAWFEVNRPLLRGLERITLEQTLLDEANAQRIAAIVPQVSWSMNEEAPLYRYVVGQE